ncbi:hypothetical protein KUTeg_021730 [Tegillarca granosa]|uniref:SWIM-type domain-containing protein n=1 Tax=Tegillarca granosa TaxID=220873 RepID=A0ABQ9E746_TEGGR|nr:hypothetical protein KUTeg_021730 [Tegillarca granosa]
MAAIVDTRDLSLVPSITFGFVKSCIKGNVHQLEKGCMIRAKCYRSLYSVMLRDGPVIESGLCSCSIGKLGICGHVTGLLYRLADMKTSQMKAVPADITWHITRGDKIAGSSADDTIVWGYNQNNPNRQPRGSLSTMYNTKRSG